MIDLLFYSRAIFTESTDYRYQDIVKKMRNVSLPLGWEGLDVSIPPEFEGDQLLAFFRVTYRDKKIQLRGTFKWRDRDTLSVDHAANDDQMSIEFPSHGSSVDYAHVLHEQFAEVTIAFSAYRAITYIADHPVDFLLQHKKEVELLRKSGANINGRNNIFTLHPAQYWDAELCQKALGYGPDEVVRRLDGQVPLVRPLMDGVYTVLNDDPDLSFETFCAINDRFKPILGLA